MDRVFTVRIVVHEMPIDPRLPAASKLAAEVFRKSDAGIGLTLRRRGNTEAEYIGGPEGRKRRNLQATAASALKCRIDELIKLYDQENSGTIGVLWVTQALGDVGERAIQRMRDRGSTPSSLSSQDVNAYFLERSQSYEKAGGEGGSGGYLTGAVACLNHAIDSKLKGDKGGSACPSELRLEALEAAHGSIGSLLLRVGPRLVELAWAVWSGSTVLQGGLDGNSESEKRCAYYTQCDDGFKMCPVSTSAAHPADQERLCEEREACSFLLAQLEEGSLELQREMKLEMKEMRLPPILREDWFFLVRELDHQCSLLKKSLQGHILESKPNPNPNPNSYSQPAEGKDEKDELQILTALAPLDPEAWARYRARGPASEGLTEMYEERLRCARGGIPIPQVPSDLHRSKGSKEGSGETAMDTTTSQTAVRMSQDEDPPEAETRQKRPTSRDAASSIPELEPDELDDLSRMPRYYHQEVF